MADEFESFVKAELPLRPVTQTNEAEETLLVRRGQGARLYVGVNINEGEVLGKLGGVITSVPSGGSDSNLLTLTASEDIGGQKAVRADALLANPSDDLTTTSYCIGISVGAALTGADITLRTKGKMTEGTWSWIAGLPIFFGVNGVLTQTPSATGYVQELGVALTATEIFIEIKQPILR